MKYEDCEILSTTKLLDEQKKPQDFSCEKKYYVTKKCPTGLVELCNSLISSNYFVIFKI